MNIEECVEIEELIRAYRKLEEGYWNIDNT